MRTATKDWGWKAVPVPSPGIHTGSGPNTAITRGYAVEVKSQGAWHTSKVFDQLVKAEQYAHSVQEVNTVFYTRVFDHNGNTYNTYP